MKKKKKKNVEKKKKKTIENVRKASLDGSDRVLKAIVVAFVIMVSVLIAAIVAKLLYKHRESHPEVVRGVLGIIVTLIVTISTYFIFSRYFVVGNEVKKISRKKKTICPSTNITITKEALNIQPVVYTKVEEVVLSKDAVVMQNRDISSKLEGGFDEEDVVKYLKNLTSELEDSEDFLQPLSEKVYSNSIEVTLDGSRMLNIGFAQVHEIRLEIKCCETITMTLVGTSISKSRRIFKCKNCSRVTSIDFYPRLVRSV